MRPEDQESLAYVGAPTGSATSVLGLAITKPVLLTKGIHSLLSKPGAPPRGPYALCQDHSHWSDPSDAFLSVSSAKFSSGGLDVLSSYHSSRMSTYQQEDPTLALPPPKPAIPRSNAAPKPLPIPQALIRKWRWRSAGPECGGHDPREAERDAEVMSAVHTTEVIGNRSILRGSLGCAAVDAGGARKAMAEYRRIKQVAASSRSRDRAASWRKRREKRYNKFETL